MLLSIGSLSCLLFLAQNTIRVPADAPTIQAAIDEAKDHDTVLVAPGTYVGVIDFLGKAITVRSEAGAGATTIDGNDGSYMPVVSFRNEEGPDSILRGFTVTGGENRFSDAWGGGISCAGDIGTFTNPTVAECVITGNRTTYSQGGGVSGSPLLEDCTISNNRTPYEAGGVYGAPVMRRCEVSGNASYEGGGLYLLDDAAVSDCVITGNTATEGARGAGVLIQGAGVVLTRCTIARNTGVGFGGKWSVYGSAVCLTGPWAAVLDRCTIVGNRIEQAGQYSDNVGGVAGGAFLYGCIVRDNDEIEVTLDASAFYTNVEGGFFGKGNMNLDPLFADAANGDYRLTAGSPCIDQGDPATELDPDGTRADMGTFYYPQANALRRNGTGANRICFESLTPPFVGSTWTAQIDANGHTGAILSGYLVVVEPREVPLPTVAGELLIRIGSLHLARQFRASSGTFDDFALPIPLDPTLVGVPVYAQALVLGGESELCNALDLKLGN